MVRDHPLVKFMSTVTPVPQQSQIRLIKGVQWDNTYKDVRLFSNDAEREQYFQGKIVGNWRECSFAKNNKIKLSGDINDVLECNYMTFINNGFGAASMYYCFILSIDYINVNAFEVTFEIDWIQSFLFNFNFKSCFIEREHVNNDALGENLVDENIDTGEYLIEKIREHTDRAGMYFLVAADNYEMERIGNIANGLLGVGFDISNVSQLNEALLAYRDNPERVAIVSMCSAKMVSAGNEINAEFIDGFTVLRDQKVFGKTDGEKYEPQNNKLLCYPYKFFTMDNYEGAIQEFRWEECEEQIGVPKCDFAFRGTAIPKPCLMCYPYRYKGHIADDIVGNGVQNYSLTYDNFPQIPWVSDTFRAWVSQNATYNSIKAGATIANMIVGFGMSTLAPTVGTQILSGASSVLSAGMQAANLYQEQKEHSIHGKQVHGGVGSSSINFQLGYIGFREVQYGITPQFAKEIDRYFTRYGYKVNKIKEPNIKGRQYFNYVKCYESHVDGNIPIDAKNVMEKSLKNGITFWHTNNIGSVYYSNPIV